MYAVGVGWGREEGRGQVYLKALLCNYLDITVTVRLRGHCEDFSYCSKRDETLQNVTEFCIHVLKKITLATVQWQYLHAPQQHGYKRGNVEQYTCMSNRR